MTAPNVKAARGGVTGIRHSEACYGDANYKTGHHGEPLRSSPLYRDGDVRRCPHGRLQMATLVERLPSVGVIRVPTRFVAWRDLSRFWSPLLWRTASRILAGDAPTPPHAWVPVTPPRGPAGTSKPRRSGKRLTPSPPPVPPRPEPKRKVDKS